MCPPPISCPSPGVEGDLQFAVKSGTTTGCSINLHYGARCRLPLLDCVVDQTLMDVQQSW